LPAGEAAQDELKRTADAFTERVQQLSAKLQLVRPSAADLEPERPWRRPAPPPAATADLPFRRAVPPSGRQPEQLLPLLLNDYGTPGGALQRIDGQIEGRWQGSAPEGSEASSTVKMTSSAACTCWSTHTAHRQDEYLARARRAAVTDIARTCAISAAATTTIARHQLALFSREVSKRQVSNLESFRIVLAPNRMRSSTSIRSSQRR
jgi:hypothetical protein